MNQTTASIVMYEYHVYSKILDGEFDPGSGQTLAACVTHASRTNGAIRKWRTGEEHVDTYLTVRNTGEKSPTIPHTFREEESRKALEDGSASD